MLVLWVLLAPECLSSAERAELVRPLRGPWLSPSMTRWAVVGAVVVLAGQALAGAPSSFASDVAGVAGSLSVGAGVVHLVGAGVMLRRGGRQVEAAWLIRRVPGWLALGIAFASVAWAIRAGTGR